MQSSFLLILTATRLHSFQKIIISGCTVVRYRKIRLWNESNQHRRRAAGASQKGGNPGFTLQRLLQNQQCSICNYYRVRPFLL